MCLCFVDVALEPIEHWRTDDVRLRQQCRVRIVSEQPARERAQRAVDGLVVGAGVDQLGRGDGAVEAVGRGTVVVVVGATVVVDPDFAVGCPSTRPGRSLDRNRPRPAPTARSTPKRRPASSSERGYGRSWGKPENETVLEISRNSAVRADVGQSAVRGVENGLPPRRLPVADGRSWSRRRPARSAVRRTPR